MGLLYHPAHALAGFHADNPDPGVPELTHLGEQWMDTVQRISQHTHPVWEVKLQLEGKTFWLSEGRRHTLNQGDAYLVAPRVSHELVHPPTGKHHFLFAGFDMNTILKRHPSLSRAWKSADRQFLILKNAVALEAPFRLLIREVLTEQPHRASGIRTALDAIAICLSRLIDLHFGNVPPSKTISVAHPAIEKAKHMMDLMPERAWRLAELAKLCGVSRAYLGELFINDAGISPRQYLLRSRIDKARRLLMESDQSITTIALNLGFSSSQHFANVCKRLTGTTPSAHRKSVEM